MLMYRLRREGVTVLVEPVLTEVSATELRPVDVGDKTRGWFVGWSVWQCEQAQSKLHRPIPEA